MNRLHLKYVSTPAFWKLYFMRAYVRILNENILYIIHVAITNENKTLLMYFVFQLIDKLFINYGGM